MGFSHKSVLLKEAVDALDIKPNGVYIDATAGGGGHCAEILSRLKGGRLIAVDQDPDAVKTLTNKFIKNKNVTVVRDNFANIKNILLTLNIDRVDGILADLGVSSHQLDTAERGFSFHNDAPLDMRMSQSGVTAADLVNELPQKEIARIISKYGEERFAMNIAKNIVKERSQEPILTTLRLAEIVKYSIPAASRRGGGHPARRTFQALRIEVNGELDKLSFALDDMFDVINTNGRLSIITFHSLEDRIVKQRFKLFCSGCTCPRDFPICVCGKEEMASLPFKVVEPSEQEIEDNPRSRSAKLRAVEKLL